MKKKIKMIVSLVMCVVLMAVPAFCESQVIYTQGAKDHAKARAEGKNKSQVVYGAGTGANKSDIDMNKFNADYNLGNMADYPIPVGASTTRVTYLGQKIPFTIVIETPYNFINDAYGNIGIAYIDERMNIPVTAMGGFYVVQKINPATKKMEWQKYCVDNSGYLLFGWIIEDDGTRYYLSEDPNTIGQVVKGAMKFANGKTYYFDEDGILQNFEE